MPIYVYRREDGSTFEVRQKFTDDALTTDPETGQAVHRVPQASGIQFKGSGFYVTDNKGATKPPATAADTNSTTDGKSDSNGASDTSTKTETKTETKPEAKSESKTAKAESKAS